MIFPQAAPAVRRWGGAAAKSSATGWIAQRDVCSPAAGQPTDRPTPSSPHGRRATFGIAVLRPVKRCQANEFRTNFPSRRNHELCCVSQRSQT